jgi:Rrf2 family nitric oxide-sensitive transcriptional repressor
MTIQEITDLHAISKNHLMKVVHELSRSGIIETVRGRHGGFRLAHEPADINIGALVRGPNRTPTWPSAFRRTASLAA